MGRAGLLLYISLCAFMTSVQAAAVSVKNIRMWPAPDNTRLVFDLSGPVEHSLFMLHQPERIVIDLNNSELQTDLSHLDYAASHIKTIRYARRNGVDTRVVLDLKGDVQPKSFILKPQREYGHRLVIDLYDKDEDKPKPVIKNVLTPTPSQARDVLIAIDAGHGGDDPGAIGRRGTREKDVVFGIAQKLEQLIAKERGMKPVMVRRGDYFVPLQNRVKIARKNNADLFISIHADAFRKPQARGSSVYILSDGNSASSDVAQFLADSENNSDMIGGVSLDDKDDLTRMVLFDMAQNVTIEDSHNLAGSVLAGLRGVTRLHKNRVEQAGFRVLKAPDIPSILVETAFISNPAEERKLRNTAHQSALARAMLNGIRVYFRDNAPKGTLLAQVNRKHRISTGETLSDIAERYRVSIALLKKVNGLHNDMLRIGQVLQIPADS